MHGGGICAILPIEIRLGDYVHTSSHDSMLVPGSFGLKYRVPSGIGQWLSVGLAGSASTRSWSGQIIEAFNARTKAISNSTIVATSSSTCHGRCSHWAVLPYLEY
jgi:hypothetical protein